MPWCRRRRCGPTVPQCRYWRRGTTVSARRPQRGRLAAAAPRELPQALLAQIFYKAHAVVLEDDLALLLSGVQVHAGLRRIVTSRVRTRLPRASQNNATLLFALTRWRSITNVFSVSPRVECFANDRDIRAPAVSCALRRPSIPLLLQKGIEGRLLNDR